MGRIATRRERVVFEADVTQFNTAMAQAAARLAALQRDVDRLDGTRVRVDVDTSGFAAAATQAAALRAQLDDIGRMRLSPSVTASFTQITRQSGATTRAVGQTSDSINQLTGRLSLAVDAALLLAPALVPIGAVGAQALGGLTAAATAAAVAGGSAIVAFQGLGDAVTAVQEYQLDPTIAGLEKAKEAMNALPRDAQRFVVEFQKFRPVLSEIRTAAAEGWFPGLTESLDKFAELGPRIEDIFFRAGEAGGFLVDQAAGSLASERWAPFMDFLEREVPTAMGSLARTVGDLAHGLTEMLMAFDPGNDSFLAWLEGVADGFDRWASSAEAQESIEGLLRYARENGPEVAALFTSLVGALSAIVQAAAPLGGPVLEGLTAVTEMIRTIADSDIATPILAGVAALRLFNRLQATAIASQARFTSSLTPVPTGRPVTAAQAAAMSGLPPHLQAALTAARQQDVRAAQAARRRQVASTGAQGAALIGTIALASSGLTDEMEGANAASLALMGTMLAPGWGTAAGLIVGGAMDVAQANDDLAESFKRVDEAIRANDFAASIQGLEEVRSQVADYTRDLTEMDSWTDRINPIAAGKAIKNSIEGVFGDSDVEEAEAELARLEAQMQRSQEAVASLGEAMGIQVGEVDGSARSIAELQRVLEAAQPAMDILGITAKDLALGEVYDDLARSDGLFGSIGQVAQDAGLGANQLNAAIDAQGDYMDSAAGKTNNFRRALAEVVRETGTAEERAKGLSDALDQLLNPRLDAEAALDQVRALMKEIRELNPDGGFRSNNEVGQQNRETSRNFVEAVQERIVTMVNAKRSEEDIARTLQKSREQFIQSGIAAGFSAEQMRRRANAIGLTPKLIETTFRALGISKADLELAALRDKFKDLPREVRTLLRTEGVPKSRQEAEALADKYKLTEKQRNTLFTLVDRASGPARTLAAALDNAARDRSATITITRRETTIQSTGDVVANPTRREMADGGLVTGPGGPRDDRIPALLSNGEFVVNAAATARNLSTLYRMNAQRFADGGLARIPTQPLAAQPLRSSSSGSRVAVDLGNVQVEGTLNTPWGPAQVKGIARATAREEIDRAREFEETHVA